MKESFDLLFCSLSFVFFLLPPSQVPNLSLSPPPRSTNAPLPYPKFLPHDAFSFSSSSSASCISRFSPVSQPPGFLFAAASTTSASGRRQQGAVSPVPSVAVEGHDQQALPTFAAFKEAASRTEFSSWLQKVRRELHSWPELMFQEHRTAALIEVVLEALQIPFTRGWGSDTYGMSKAAAEHVRAAKRGTGVVAHVGTGAEPCVVLRADMDALPIFEKTDVPFRSQRDNIMHACGHDVHTTMLLGAAALLKAVEPQLKGTVRLLFQPAEEGGGGGWCMREEGALRLFPPARLIFGHHVNPGLPTGVLATRTGVFYAAVTNFTIEIEGKGGHAALPDLAVDAGPAVAALLQAIYAIGSREVARAEDRAGLITVTKIHGGTALNVIPPSYEIGGTIRALSEAMQTRLENRLQEAAEHVAAAFRCVCRVHIHPRRYPPLVNDAKATELYRMIMNEASASGKVEEGESRMGGEDFAFYLSEVPGTFASIGTGSGAEVPGQPRSDYSLHSDLFAVDERVLSHGAAMEAHLAVEALHHLSQEDKAAAAAERGRGVPSPTDRTAARAAAAASGVKARDISAAAAARGMNNDENPLGMKEKDGTPNNHFSALEHHANSGAASGERAAAVEYADKNRKGKTTKHEQQAPSSSEAGGRAGATGSRAEEF